MHTIPDTPPFSESNSSADSRRDAPIAISPEDFRKLGHELVDSLASLFAGMRDRPVAAGTTPSVIRQLLGTGGIPENGEDPRKVLESAAEILFQHSTFNGHPKFFGYITAPPAPIGVLGELLAAGVNANVGATSLAPVATEIERQTVRWIAEFIGFPASCGGIFVSGGNMANMVCMLVARSATLSKLSDLGGTELNGKFRIYASSETHTWIEKAIDIMGLGSDAYRKIPADGMRRIRLDALRNAIAEDKQAGLIPLAIIGTAGTVSTGDIDPLREIQALCDEEGIWFHVDGAYGAPAAALPDASDDLKALSGAHSVAVDPHKWFYAPIEAGCSLIRDQSLLRQTFAHSPPYYHFNDSEGEPAFNFLEYGPQNTRGFRALKVWLAMRHVGRAGYVKMIQDDCKLARVMFDAVKANEYLDPVSCELSITTFAFVPPDVPHDERSDYLNELNTQLLSELQQNGEVYFSNAVVDGRFLLRACIVNFRTTAEDVRKAVEIVVRTGLSVHGKMMAEKR